MAESEVNNLKHSVPAASNGGTFREAGRIVGRGEQAQTLHLPLSRCDKLEVRLDGKGPFCLLEFVRGFTVGSDV